MNAEDWAALGCRRGSGESLASWLRAGPVGAHVSGSMSASTPPEGDLYCPACWVEEAGRRRWYSRGEWSMDGLVCTTHDLPLVRCKVPPVRLRGRRWPLKTRDQFRALGQWWQQGGVDHASRLIIQALRARTDPRLPYSRAWAEAQWHLWATGWPVLVAPRPSAHGALVPILQSDRLALHAIVHDVCIALDTGQHTLWPPLPIRMRVLSWLERRMSREQLDWATRLQSCFRAITPTRTSR